MINLRYEQLLKLCTMIYQVDFVTEDNDYEGKKMSYVIDDAIRKANEYPEDHAFPVLMTRQDWLDLLNMIKNDPVLMNLTIDNAISLDPPGTVREEGEDNTRLRAVCLVNDDGEAAIIFRGTGDNQWEDNGWGAISDTTQTIEDALEYINSQKYDDILLAGHSGGGNAAQVGAIRAGDKVGGAVSFDGQGVPRIFLEKYEEEVIKYQDNIISFRGENDFVSTLLYPLALPENTIFIETEEFDGVKVPYNHSPYVKFDSEGHLRNIGEQGNIAKFVNDVSIFYSENYGDTRHREVIVALMSFLQRDSSYSTSEQLYAAYIMLGEIMPEYFADFSDEKYQLLYNFYDDIIPDDFLIDESFFTYATIDILNKAELGKDTLDNNLILFYELLINRFGEKSIKKAFDALIKNGKNNLFSFAKYWAKSHYYDNKYYFGSKITETPKDEVTENISSGNVGNSHFDTFVGPRLPGDMPDLWIRRFANPSDDTSGDDIREDSARAKFDMFVFPSLPIFTPNFQIERFTSLFDGMSTDSLEKLSDYLKTFDLYKSENTPDYRTNVLFNRYMDNYDNLLNRVDFTAVLSVSDYTSSSARNISLSERYSLNKITSENDKTSSSRLSDADIAKALSEFKEKEFMPLVKEKIDRDKVVDIIAEHLQKEAMVNPPSPYSSFLR